MRNLPHSHSSKAQSQVRSLPRPMSAWADGVGGRADPILAVAEWGIDGFCCQVSCGWEQRKESCFYSHVSSWTGGGAFT